MAKSKGNRGGQRVGKKRGLFTIRLATEKHLRANGTSSGGHEIVHLAKYDKNTRRLLNRKMNYAQTEHKRRYIRDAVDAYFRDDRLLAKNSVGSKLMAEMNKKGGKIYDNSIKPVQRGYSKKYIEKKFIYGTRGYKEAMEEYKNFAAYNKYRRGLAKMDKIPKRTEESVDKLRRFIGGLVTKDYKPLSKAEIDRLGVKTLETYIQQNRLKGVKVERHTRTVNDDFKFSKHFERRFGKKNLYDSNGNVFRDSDGGLNIRYYNSLIQRVDKYFRKAQRDYRKRNKLIHQATPPTIDHIFHKWTPSFVKNFVAEDWAKQSHQINKLFKYNTPKSAWIKPGIPKSADHKLRKLRQEIIRKTNIATMEAQDQLMRELEYVKQWNNLTGNAYTGIMSAAYVTTDRMSVHKEYKQLPGVRGRRATRGKISAGRYKRYYRTSNGQRESLKTKGARVYITRSFDNPSHYVFINADSVSFKETSGKMAYDEALSILNAFNPRMDMNNSGQTMKHKGVVATLKVVSGASEYTDDLKTAGGNPIMLVALQRAEQILAEKMKHLL